MDTEALGKYAALCACVCVLSHVQLFAALWTAAHQAPLSMGFSSQEYRGGLPCPPPVGLPNPGVEPTSLGLLHGKWILHPLSHLESPYSTIGVFKNPTVVPWLTLGPSMIRN